MSTRMRPRFELLVDPSADEAMERLKTRFARGDSRCYVDVYDRQLEIRIRREYHHTWSPELNLLFREVDGKTQLHGKFGPGPHVWTLFMAGYAAFGMIMLAGLLMAASQWTIDGDVTSGWFALVGLAGCVLVWVAAQIGQRLAEPQMEVIRSAIHEEFD